MTTEAILKPIGKGQWTIPQAWRKALGIESQHVRARLEAGRVIIEPLEKPTELDWDVKQIQLDVLNDETIAAIKESEENYKAGRSEKFRSLEFWESVNEDEL